MPCTRFEGKNCFILHFKTSKARNFVKNYKKIFLKTRIQREKRGYFRVFKILEAIYIYKTYRNSIAFNMLEINSQTFFLRFTLFQARTQYYSKLIASASKTIWLITKFTPRQKKTAWIETKKKIEKTEQLYDQGWTKWFLYLNTRIKTHRWWLRLCYA